MYILKRSLFHPSIQPSLFPKTHRTIFYFISCNHHHHSLDRCCGGARMEVSIKTLHCFLSLAAGSRAVGLWPVYSLVLSYQDLCWETLQWVPSAMPWRIVLPRELWQVTWVYQASLQCLIMLRSGSCLPAWLVMVCLTCSHTKLIKATPRQNANKKVCQVKKSVHLNVKRCWMQMKNLNPYKKRVGKMEES